MQDVLRHLVGVPHQVEFYRMLRRYQASRILAQGKGGKVVIMGVGDQHVLQTHQIPAVPLGLGNEVGPEVEHHFIGELEGTSSPDIFPLQAAGGLAGGAVADGVGQPLCGAGPQENVFVHCHFQHLYGRIAQENCFLLALPNYRDCLFFFFDNVV